MPLLVGLAEPGRPGGGADLAGSIVARVEQALNVRFHPQHSRAYASGHTASVRSAARRAATARGPDVPACVVCGVDSFINAATLLWLDRHFRLKTPANRDGVIPGEAAAAVLVQASLRPRDGGSGRPGVRQRKGADPFGGAPARPWAYGGRSVGTVGGKLGLHEIDLRLSDVTGELYGFKELPLVEGRLMRVVRKQGQPLWHWAEAIGDSGAAAGVLQLVLADEAFRKGYAPGSGDLHDEFCGGERAAAVLRRCRGDASAQTTSKGMPWAVTSMPMATR